MAFTGTLDKCNACDKTVYVVDLLSLEGVPYHKSCFRCSHCKGFLSMSSYSSMDGVLYCKPHFEQLFKESGNFSKNFHTAKSSEKSHETSKNSNKLSSLFSGTQDKCAVCTKTVYPLEKVTLEGECYHKTCFRCAHAGCPLTHSSYAALDGVLYCRHHFAQLFMEKGDYNHVKQVTAHKKNTASHDQSDHLADGSHSDKHPSQDQNDDDTKHEQQDAQS
ncbi:LIM domain-containing protein PLIM2c-like [Neltuma alba]|uniref:LIM domain-containing protein PLIM2c-like n=1 Tax=Neltuma alba TaxID=207710 RepID=UPI0010A58FBF|nr:LIM domain-containing protein PLIM2c-like [Prosopis alba]XP_028783703.1 LIM domain-containing protein PLIM2c-like [Prosopis alba]